MIRHAEAEGNRYRRIHGHYDTNVTENGLRQIEALAQRFQTIPIDAVYSSDLTRTCRTAQALAGPKHLPIQKDPRFREIDLGTWEDVPFGELAETDPVQMNNFNRNPRVWRAEGAERFEQFTARFLEGLRCVAEQNREKTIAIFTHGGVLAQSLSVLFPDSKPGHSDNTAVTKLTYDGEFHLEYASDNSHLSEEISTLARQHWWRENAKQADRNLWFSPYEGEIDWYLRLADEEIPVAPMAVIAFAMLGKKPVGIVQLDPQRDQKQGAGFIDYLGLDPQYRGQRLGMQLIGCAVSYYRSLGRTRLRVVPGERYASSAGFFEKDGFSSAGDGVYEKIILVPDGK